MNREEEDLMDRIKKNHTEEGDLVLVNMDGNPAFFARIESITADVKPGWYQVKMLVLQVPLMVITWILRDVYIDGEEFTMGGRPMKLEKVVAPEAEDAPDPSEWPAKIEKPKKEASQQETTEKPKVVSLSDRRKKDQSS
jgi:hypothetical protein